LDEEWLDEEWLDEEWLARSLTVPVAITVYNMIIDQPHGLHMGITDGGSKKLKPTLFHIFANSIR